jgi:hypothetical protein
MFGAGLLAAIAVAGVGYQEVRAADGFRRTEWERFDDDVWGW